jgi:hypothetical protein
LGKDSARIDAAMIAIQQSRLKLIRLSNFRYFCKRMKMISLSLEGLT